MNRRVWGISLLIFIGCLNAEARAQVTIGPFTAVHVLRKYPYMDMPIWGLSGSVPLNHNFRLSAEYQTFGSQRHFGSELSTPLSTILEWRNERRLYQVIGGVHYQLRSRITHPRLFFGIHLGHEWHLSKTKLVEIPAGQQVQTEYFKGSTQRLLLFPSMTFIHDWRRFEFFSQVRAGLAFPYARGFHLKSPIDFAQLSAGVHLKLR